MYVDSYIPPELKTSIDCHMWFLFQLMRFSYLSALGALIGVNLCLNSLDAYFYKCPLIKKKTVKLNPLLKEFCRKIAHICSALFFALLVKPKPNY